jgi:hypothetical protein
MSGSFEFDERHPRIVIVHYHTLMSDADFEATLARFDHIMASRSVRYVVILNVCHAKMGPFAQARRQAEWMRDRAALMRSKVLGIAMVMPSAVIRGVMHVITGIQPMPVTYAVMSTLQEAQEWAAQQILKSPDPSSPSRAESKRSASQ